MLRIFRRLREKIQPGHERPRIALPKGPLREFVYLDEVSVYSLHASKIGMPDEQITESQQRSMQAETAGSGTVQVPYLGKGDISAKIQGQFAANRQTVRKSIIQTTFVRLVESLRGDFRFSVPPPDCEMPAPRTADELLDKIDQKWIIHPETLSRGVVGEIHFTLDTDSSFQFQQLLASFTKMFGDIPDVITPQDFAKAGAMARVIDNLMLGLVPIHGEAPNFRVAIARDTELIVRTEVAENLEDVPTVPLYVAGLADQTLFWKDTRRILFSPNRYTALCRIARSGVHESWSPIPALESIKRLIPDAAEAFSAFQKAIAKPAIKTADPGSAHSVKLALVNYARSLAEKLGVEVHAAELDARHLLVVAPKLSAKMTVDDWRDLCAPVTDYIAEKHGFQIPPEMASDFRAAAFRRMRSKRNADTEVPDSIDLADERVLEVEFIAIYW